MLRELELLDVASLYWLLPVQARTTEDTEGTAGTRKRQGDGSVEIRGNRQAAAAASKGLEACACLVLGEVEAGTDAARLLEAMLAAIGLQAGKDYQVAGLAEAAGLDSVRLVLALGPEAAARARALDGPAVVSTLHPAELIANPLDKARAWEDLLRARRTLQDAGISDA